MAKRDERWYLWLPGLATVIAVPFQAFVYLYEDAVTALFVAVIPTMLGAFYLGPGFALTQRLVGVRMRALAASILLFITNLIGLGLGPQLVGILSDVYQATTSVGVDSLRWSMTSVLVLNVISWLLYLVAAKYLIQDLARPKD